jgi:hypothetical protein
MMIGTAAMTHTPTANDILHTEAVNLATDTATMLHEFRDRVGPDEAFAVATEVLGLSDHVIKARDSVTTEKAREHFAQARTVCQRTLIAMERLAARNRIPLMRSANLHERLSSLARALQALSERPPWE